MLGLLGITIARTQIEIKHVMNSIKDWPYLLTGGFIENLNFSVVLHAKKKKLLVFNSPLPVCLPLTALSDPWINHASKHVLLITLTRISVSAILRPPQFYFPRKVAKKVSNDYTHVTHSRLHRVRELEARNIITYKPSHGDICISFSDQSKKLSVL